MQKSIIGTIRALLGATLCAFSAAALSQNPPELPQGAVERRELIYCADQMTHEEREAYRAKMRAARTEEEKVALRQAHRQEMQTRARQGGGAAQCEPVRLRLRGGRGQ